MSRPAPHRPPGSGQPAPARVSVPDADLAAFTWGNAGPAVLALHPGVGDSRIWHRCAPTWARAGHRVIAYDRRGFGDSRWQSAPHDEIADLRAVTAATGARPAVVVGNSRGGGLALDLALDHPDEVRALVLVAPAPSGFPYDQWQMTAIEEEQDALVAAAEEAGDLEELNRLEVRYWLDGVDSPEGRVQGWARELMVEMNARALHAPPAGASATRTPAWPRLDRIDVPTLVLVGSHDLPGEVDLCRRLADAVPHATLAVIPGAGHCPSLDQPAQLDRLVLDFLRDHSAPMATDG